MVRRRAGHIVNVTSVASYLAWPDACGYIAARHALGGFNDALRAEAEGTGVDVTLVVMGTVDSPYWSHNAGSRERVPRAIPGLMPVLSTEDAADLIIHGIETNKARLTRPRIFALFFVLYALFPRRTGRMFKA
jgi:short-subunit dehydrogenase